MNQNRPSFTEWRKSSYSGDTGGQCVEVAAFSGDIGFRDSKNPGTAHLVLTRSAFRTFTRKLRSEPQK
ncbi:DUF397 domain-containing protein [Actinocorallia libanotica]|uniref:DUF397 domain-containing protein n=1 Tax=Actinocorallia libanotica TaxID=46162 RepID=A0ABP4BGJ5_9ACTN